MELETITPATAKRWLEASRAWAEAHPDERNRPVVTRRVQRYVEIIKAGEWQVTNQGIMLGTGDVVIDGQHRLTAIAEAGIPCRAYVLRRPDVTSPLHVAVDVDAAARRKWWILGLRRADYEVANMILTFAAMPPDRRRLTYSCGFSSKTLELMTDWVGQVGITTSPRKIVSQVPVRVGVALAWSQHPEAVEQYAALVGQDYSKLWPVVASFGSQLSDAELRNARLQRREVLVRAWKAFSAKGRGRNLRLRLGRNDSLEAHKVALWVVGQAGITLK